MRDFTETAKRMLDLIPADCTELRFQIQTAISSDNYRAPEATRYSWTQLQRALGRHFDGREPGSDWEREICAIMRGERETWEQVQ